MSESITPQDFSDIRWRGHWIWVPEEPIVPSGGWAGSIDPNAKESHGLFRRSFTLDHLPDRAPTRITADSRYALFVNGRAVGAGRSAASFANCTTTYMTWRPTCSAARISSRST